MIKKLREINWCIFLLSYQLYFTEFKKCFSINILHMDIEINNKLKEFNFLEFWVGQNNVRLVILNIPIINNNIYEIDFFIDDINEKLLFTLENTFLSFYNIEGDNRIYVWIYDLLIVGKEIDIEKALIIKI